MNEQNTQRIIDACPSLFETRYDGDVILPIRFGFECGDGWADLLVELCTNINNHLKTLPKHISEEIVALQVKEKYGTLRFYISSFDETIEKFISHAEKRSADTCETCGKPGRMRGDFWLYTACDEHTHQEDLPSNESSQKTP
jgi:hypothetical protein